LSYKKAPVKVKGATPPKAGFAMSFQDVNALWIVF